MAVLGGPSRYGQDRFPGSSTEDGGSGALEPPSANGFGGESRRGDDGNDDDTAVDDKISVYLRLRPMNKLEASRRSKNCVEVHAPGNKGLTVDSPLDGEYDFNFDRVFDEDAPQSEVFDNALSSVAPRLLRGYNCTVLAYGQTGSGKTHSMMGVGGDTSGGQHQRRRASAGSVSALAAEELLGEASSAGGEAGSLDGNAAENDGLEDAEDAGPVSDPADETEAAYDNTEPNRPDEISGMIPRTIKSIFRQMERTSPSIEYTVRVSYVELYLEKMLDLLSNKRDKGKDEENDDVEGGDTLEDANGDRDGGVGKGLPTARPTLRVMEEDSPADEAGGGTATARPGASCCSVWIDGASEACCLDESDVLALLARGNACRTVSSNKMSTESSRSTAVFILKIEQRHVETGVTKTSVLHMVDLAGSELAGKANVKAAGAGRGHGQGGSAVQTEAKMTNKSLNALNALVRNLVEEQRREQARENTSAASGSEVLNAPSQQQTHRQSPHRRSKLTRILRPCFGGNCLTTLLLTASPSSYNISETLNTIRFGQRCRRIRNNPLVNTEDSPVLYRKKLAESERERKELMSLVRALATECKGLKDAGAKENLEDGKRGGPLWESINTILEKNEDAPGDVDGILEQARWQRRKEEVDGNVEGESLDTAAALEKLREEAASSAKARDHAESALSELQSEVAVLRTQNENLSADKKKMMQDLIDAKNDVQILSQRKLEVEHNLRTSQFRENEATVFLRQFRRFYRRLLRNKAAQGTGSTAEITAKVPGVPDLNDLIDVDTLLLESGLIEEEEVHDDASSGTYRPSSAALLRSTAAAKKAAKEAAALDRAAGIEDGTSEESSLLSSAGSVGSSIRRRPIGSLQIAPGAETLDVISEMGDGGVSEAAWSAGDRHRAVEGISEDGESQTTPGEGGTEGNSADDIHSIGARRLTEGIDREEAPRSAQDTSAGGADAGAGSSPTSDLYTETESSLLDSESTGPLSISRGTATSYTASTITNRQKLLRTPSGRLTTMREKDLERDLLQMTERCIELQIALNEEKANVDVLTNRSGSLSKKRLAQEAISLRQALDRKTHDLQAIIWKMNELHLINKTYNEKMANREQHVTYLEENLVDLQNTNRRLIMERQEAEKKLRDELESLKVLVDAMTVPLWQFGECQGVSGRTLASRVVVPVRGGLHDKTMEWEEAKANVSDSGSVSSSDERPLSRGLALGDGDRDDNAEEEDASRAALAADVGTDLLTSPVTGAVIAERSPSPPIPVKVPQADAMTQTEEKETADIETMTDDPPALVDAETMTDKTEEEVEAAVLPEIPTSLEEVAETTEMSTQTDALPEPEPEISAEALAAAVAEAREKEKVDLEDKEVQVDIKEEAKPPPLTVSIGVGDGDLSQAGEVQATGKSQSAGDDAAFAAAGAAAGAAVTAAALACDDDDNLERRRESGADRSGVSHRSAQPPLPLVSPQAVDWKESDKGAIVSEGGGSESLANGERAATNTQQWTGASRGEPATQPSGSVIENDSFAPSKQFGDNSAHVGAGRPPESLGAATAEPGDTSTQRDEGAYEDQLRKGPDQAHERRRSLDASSEASFPVPTKEVEFHAAGDSKGSPDNVSANSPKSLGPLSASAGQLPETMFPGGKPASHRPRRFVRKLGPRIKPGVLKESKKKSGSSGSVRESSSSGRIRSSETKSIGSRKSRKSRSEH